MIDDLGENTSSVNLLQPFSQALHEKIKENIIIFTPSEKIIIEDSVKKDWTLYELYKNSTHHGVFSSHQKGILGYILKLTADKENKKWVEKIVSDAEAIITQAKTKLEKHIQIEFKRLDETNLKATDEDTLNQKRLMQRMLGRIFSDSAVESYSAAGKIYTALLVNDLVNAIEIGNLQDSNDDNLKTLKELEELIRVSNPAGATAIRTFCLMLTLATLVVAISPFLLHTAATGVALDIFAKWYAGFMAEKILIACLGGTVAVGGAVPFILFNGPSGNKEGAEGIKEFRTNQKIYYLS